MIYYTVLLLQSLLLAFNFGLAQALAQGCLPSNNTFDELAKILANASNSERKGVDSEGVWLIGSGGPELVESPDVQASLDTLFAGNITYQRCILGDNWGPPVFDMKTICSTDYGTCLSMTLYEGQTCASTNLCMEGIGPGLYGFVFDCKGISQQYPDCAMNTCTKEGADTCFKMASVSTAPTGIGTTTGSDPTADSSESHGAVSRRSRIMGRMRIEIAMFVAFASWIL